ncbi:IS200/IS605 family transposase [Streptomyces sp. NPDC001635]
MRKVCEDFGAELREFNGETDHVHLLVHYPPRIALSRLVGSLKGVSACARTSPPTSTSTYGANTFGSPSYFAGSCGGTSLAVVKDYIENQKHPDWARHPRGNIAKQCGGAPRRPAPDAIPPESEDPGLLARSG